jgi:hypothetical protein
MHFVSKTEFPSGIPLDKEWVLETNHKKTSRLEEKVTALNAKQTRNPIKNGRNPQSETNIQQ